MVVPSKAIGEPKRRNRPGGADNDPRQASEQQLIVRILERCYGGDPYDPQTELPSRKA
jgi:hypothetical protein